MQFHSGDIVCRLSVLSHPCSWQRHAGVTSLFEVLQWLATTKPKGGVFENVTGLATETPGERSPLEMIISELSDMNFAATAVHSNLAQFQDVTRHRTSEHCLSTWDRQPLENLNTESLSPFHLLS